MPPAIVRVKYTSHTPDTHRRWRQRSRCRRRTAIFHACFQNEDDYMSLSESRQPLLKQHEGATTSRARLSLADDAPITPQAADDSIGGCRQHQGCRATPLRLAQIYIRRVAAWAYLPISYQ